MTASEAYVRSEIPPRETIALRGTFDPRHLISRNADEPLSDDDVRTLSDLSGLCDECPRPGGQVLWSMTPDSRRHALTALAEAERLHLVAARSMPDVDDHLGHALRQLIVGEPQDRASMSREQIEATWRAARFLRPVGIVHDMSGIEEIMRSW